MCCILEKIACCWLNIMSARVIHECLQDAWNSWMNFAPGNKTDDQIRNDFLHNTAPNR